MLKRTKRQNEDGTFRRKKVLKSYPNFKAPGPIPFQDISEAEMAADEELCFLTGTYSL